jgi:pimeloyl-ACP methyl ester carboxylesterase
LTDVWSATTGVDDGPQITLVHGSLDRSAGLLKLSRRLDDRYRVTRYDRRGYGRSAPHDGPFGLDQHVDDLRQLLARQGAERRPRVIVAHSYGGNVALALAQRDPGLVDGVVVYETPLSWREWWPGDSAGSDAVAWRADPEQAAERFMRRLISDDRWERLPASTRASRRREGAAMVGELLDLRARPAWRGEEIDLPVMAMRGEFGADHHRRGTESIAAEIDGAELVVMAGAKHAGPNTHPDAVADAVDEFVRRRVKPATRG